MSVRALRSHDGQAEVELIAAVPLLFAAAAAVLQLLAVGYSQSLADGAAEAAAIAVADGRNPERAAGRALPAWAREELRVRAETGGVRVELAAPALLPAPARALRVSSSAWSFGGER